MNTPTQLPAHIDNYLDRTFPFQLNENVMVHGQKQITHRGDPTVVELVYIISADEWEIEFYDFEGPDQGWTEHFDQDEAAARARWAELG